VGDKGIAPWVPFSTASVGTRYTPPWVRMTVSSFPLWEGPTTRAAAYIVTVLVVASLLLILMGVFSSDCLASVSNDVCLFSRK
jgi:hypothetical protein